MVKKLGRYKVRALGDSLVITLPREWLESADIKAKDYAELYQDDDVLLLAKEKPVSASV